MGCYFEGERGPRDWVADPPRFRTFAVYGHAGAWAYELPPAPRSVEVFRLRLLVRADGSGWMSVL